MHFPWTFWRPLVHKWMSVAVFQGNHIYRFWNLNFMQFLCHEILAFFFLQVRNNKAVLRPDLCQSRQGAGLGQQTVLCWSQPWRTFLFPMPLKLHLNAGTQSPFISAYSLSCSVMGWLRWTVWVRMLLIIREWVQNIPSSKQGREIPVLAPGWRPLLLVDLPGYV